MKYQNQDYFNKIYQNYNELKVLFAYVVTVNNYKIVVDIKKLNL